MSNIFLEKSIPSILKKIAKGEISFRDLIDVTTEAINSKEKNTSAWVCFDLEKIKKESEKSDLLFKKRGHLLGIDGIPFGVKDIFNTKSFPTEMGSPLWKNFTPGNNARVVDSLLTSGGILVGKTITAEFAVHSLNETLNPHDKSRTPGTSSSGSAAAVSTGMVPFALGTQTAGSIIRPASFCGVWGMKPSFGMIPRTGSLKTTDSFDTVGFVTAHGESLRTILDNTRIKGPNYPFVYNRVEKTGNFPKINSSPWRIGFVRTHTWGTTPHYAKNALEDLAKKIDLENNFNLEEIDWPDNFRNIHETHSIIYNKSLSYYFKNEKNIGNQITQNIMQMIDEGESISLSDFKHALRIQEDFCEKIESLLSPFDIVLSPGTSGSAPKRGVVELPDPSLIWTLGHVPSISVPLFRCPEGLPFSAQIISRKWNDYLLLQGVEEFINLGIFPSGSNKIIEK